MRKVSMTLAGLVLAGVMSIGCDSGEAPEPMDSGPAGGAATPQEATDMQAAQAATAAQEAAKRDGTAAGATATDASVQAQKLIDEAVAYIKDNKLDLAEKALQQAEGMRASLTPELQKALDTAKTSLTAAKAAGGVKLPGV